MIDAIENPFENPFCRGRPPRPGGAPGWVSRCGSDRVVWRGCRAGAPVGALSSLEKPRHAHNVVISKIVLAEKRAKHAKRVKTGGEKAAAADAG